MDVKDEHLEAHLADPAHPPSIEPWSDVYHDNVQPPRATHDSGAPVQLEVNHVPVHQAEIIDDPGHQFRKPRPWTISGQRPTTSFPCPSVAVAFAKTGPSARRPAKRETLRYCSRERKTENRL
ncbi:hypothetical protein PSTT_02321 [Puccinia striiformis]|uniref:Uncharacterized protein n=1 Tax=Puccinia striiformis TaxID=27350 RepID=A0A2S4W0U0_9BASI|nr:hypothetical protein PSTT_02321 [Puccinia striiformis]